MKQFCSPHVHTRSFDSASTPEAFALRELELGGEYLTSTDHGSLEAVRHVYDLCHNDKRFKGKLTPILGIEAFFRDDLCPILKERGVEKTVRYRNQLTGKTLKQEAYDKLGPADRQLCIPEYGYWEHLKYMHLTLHALDEEAMMTLIRLISKADLRAEQHGSERKPLFDWNDLEELGSKNITMGSSCLIGGVSRHLLAHDDYHTAIRYYDRLRSIVKPGNFLVELFPHICDRNWDSGTFVKYNDGTEEKFTDWKKLLILDSKGKEYSVKAGVVADDFQVNPQAASEKYLKLVAIMQNRKMVPLEAPKLIVGAENREGFILNECRSWVPDRDVMLGCNRFVAELAKRHGDPVVVSDDAHMANFSDKCVQDVRLGQSGSWKFANVYSRLSTDEAWRYFKDKMGTTEKEFESWVDNSHAWGSRFKDFRFTSRKSLPTSFYPKDTLKHTIELINKYGRMDWNDQAHRARLQAEINLLHYNGTADFLPYFFIDEEVVDVHLRAGRLTGPGRGSAGGLELAYTLGITHVDPLRYGLSMDRFMTKTRIESGKWPDIDQDLSDRELLEGWEEPGLEVEFEDGSKKTVPVGTKVKTVHGDLDIREALARGLDVELKNT